MWMDNVREWTALGSRELFDAAHNRARRRMLSVEISRRASFWSARSRDEWANACSSVWRCLRLFVRVRFHSIDQPPTKREANLIITWLPVAFVVHLHLHEIIFRVARYSDVTWSGQAWCFVSSPAVIHSWWQFVEITEVVTAMIVKHDNISFKKIYPYYEVVSMSCEIRNNLNIHRNM